MNEEKDCQRPRNPKEGSNPIAQLFFLYMFPVFWKNFKKEPTEEDLFEPLEEHKSELIGREFEEVWTKEDNCEEKLSLHRALFKYFGLRFVVYGILQFINEMLLVTIMPLATGKFISYFESGNNVGENKAYMYAGLIIFCMFFDAFSNHQTAMALMHLAVKMRVACCSLIYRKSLRLTQSTLAQITTGHVINLLSNDVGNFDGGLIVCHYIWIAPIQVLTGTYLLYNTVGVSAFSGVAFLFIFIPVQIYFGKKISILSMRTALRTDERVGLMSEILNGIQVIKMYAWEKLFAKLIALARRLEIREIRLNFFLNSITFALSIILPRLAVFITIIVYMTLGNTINAEKVYSVMAIYEALRPPFGHMFAMAISSIAEIHVSICRIHKFLVNPDLSNITPRKLHTTPSDLPESASVCNSGLSSSEFPQTDSSGLLSPHLDLSGVDVSDLNSISFKDPASSITLKGVWTKYSEEPVLSNITLTIDNQTPKIAIVGAVGSGKTSLLNVILKELPISAGFLDVQGKISYAPQEPWLFSGSVRQNILFGSPYERERYNMVIKVCALEADLDLLPHGDRTIVGEKGKTLSGGQKARISLARCVYRRADIYLLDDPLSAVDSKVCRHIYDECIMKFLADKICLLVTHQVQYLHNFGKVVVLDKGQVVQEDKSDLELLDERKSKDVLEAGSVQRDNLVGSPELSKEEIQSGSIKARTYFDYFRHGGNVLVMGLLVMAFMTTQGIENTGDYFISIWVNSLDSNETAFENQDVMYIYSGITGAIVACALLQSIFFFVFFMRASIHIHDSIFATVSHATSRFFNQNPSGRILNRFADDLNDVDEYIPGILGDVVEIFLSYLGAVILTSIVNPWYILPSTTLFLIFYLMRKIYLKTSRSVKRIEGAVRSPFLAHVTATIQGITTIRALASQELVQKDFDTHQDLHTSAWFLFIASSKAFAFWLDVTCTTLVSMIIISLMIFNEDYYGGDAGLVITQYLSLVGVLQWGMHEWSQLENHMTSVERILEYEKIPTEPTRDAPIEPDWPGSGQVVFRNVSMKYNPDEPNVLQDVSFSIASNEKIGVVGRTGAGKTTLVAALFQLYDLEGCITIDDVNLNKISLEVARSKISIIPQDAVLFSGTVRKNLDPFDEYPDQVLWRALQEVELSSSVELDGVVNEGGCNLSFGQRQLICLARALVRRNKILVMDEATANVDQNTDRLIQKTIKEQFAECTVITIAHRLNTIMDSDKVLVMDAGRVVEFGHPYLLLQNSHGKFYGMVETTGTTSAEYLKSIAEENYTKWKS